jgi:hypothetical protein
MMAFDMPISAKSCENPITTITIPIKPKSDGERRRAKTARVKNWRIVTTPIENPPHFIPVIACDLRFTQSFLAANLFFRVLLSYNIPIKKPLFL